MNDVSTLDALAADPVVTTNGLSVVSIAKSYDKRVVLSDVSLSVGRGEVVGLLGPNGAGKTTCFYSIMGLVKPDSGRIMLDGADITGLPMYRRAILGLGAGWFELEHDQLGFDFGTFTERFDKLTEALDIILPMLAGERPTVNGKYYRTDQAMANPRYRDHIPLMIGGSGEKKTIPLAARHFDHLNIIAGLDELPGKLDVVRARCEDVDRDPATLETSTLISVVVDENATPDQLPEAFRNRAAVGTPTAIAEQIRAKVFDAGLDGVIFNMPMYTPGVLASIADALRPVLPA